MLIIEIICSWYWVGGFDWVNDMFECMQQQKEEKIIYSNITYKELKNITNVIPEESDVAMPGIKENKSILWQKSKKTTGVIRYN